MKNSTTCKLFSGLLAVTFFACSPPKLISTPIANIDVLPLKIKPLSETALKNWGAADLIKDTIPGMSITKAYTELLKGKQGAPVIVGVVDSGIDIEHEDLKNVIWTNTKEIPGNQKDDDNNGYVDDIHGWNFLGDVIGENLEYVRIIRSFRPKFDGKSITDIAPADQANFNMYQKAIAELEKEHAETTGNLNQYEGLLNQVTVAHDAISKNLGKTDYSLNELSAIKADDASLKQHQEIISQMFGFLDAGEKIPDLIHNLSDGIKHFKGRLDTHFNLNLNARAIVGDDPDDLSDTKYGNADVDGPDPKEADAKHGTHVAGIIAAQRNNTIGMDGVASNVKIMCLRAVPDGDEYDKDIALAIRYAVDNGAKVINASFGKYFSNHPEWVRDAIKYAESKDVLIVKAAGNEGLNLDENVVYPNDQNKLEKPISNNFLTVGALNYTYGSELIAPFSNYGNSNVDVFAPGVKIWASTPLNTYEYLQGTSMASPAVAGVAAIIRSHYPKLKAAQVKKIIMDSGVSTTANVVVAGDPANTEKFASLSKSGKMVNLYNALIMASKF